MQKSIFIFKEVFANIDEILILKRKGSFQKTTAVASDLSDFPKVMVTLAMQSFLSEILEKLFMETTKTLTTHLKTFWG